MEKNKKKLLESFEEKCPLCKKGKLKVVGEKSKIRVLLTCCTTCPYASYREIENESEI
jgi:hypothetical protein